MRTQDTKGEPASPFVCRLTMDVFREPVVSPSGLSYERSALLEHLAKVAGRALGFVSLGERLLYCA